MKYVALARLALGLSITLSIAVAACSDTSSPAGDSPNGGNAPPGSPGSGPGPGDTSNHGTTTPPTVADSFTLSVHVGSGSSATDTMHSVPVPGATVSISKTVWKFIHGNGADTMAGTQVDVASATADANGDVRFDRLSLDLYRIEADPPAGSGLESRAVKVPLVTVANVRVPLILTKAP